MWQACGLVEPHSSTTTSVASARGKIKPSSVYVVSAPGIEGAAICTCAKQNPI